MMSSLLKQRVKKGKPQDGKQWIHPADLLINGDVVYAVKLLGVTEVAQAKGTEVIKDAITKVQFAKHIKQSEAGKKASKLRKVDLKISSSAIKVEDTKTKEEIYNYPLHHISYCADDKRSKKIFAFIAKDKSNPQHTCYVFECEKMAEELTLTVGQAFDIAYRRYLENVGRQKLQAAESEKTEMKQKLSQLEKSQENTTAPAESVNKTELPSWSSQAPANNKEEDINLFGDATPVPGIPPPPPKQTRPAKTNIDTFDPFDMSSPTTNGDLPSNSLSEFDQQPVAPHIISSPFEDSPTPSPNLNKVSNPFDQMFEQPSTAPVSSGAFVDSFDPLDSAQQSQPNITPPAANTLSTSFFGSDLVDNSNTVGTTINNSNNNTFGAQPVQRPRPTPRTQVPTSLPPPPSKQSVKAAKMAAAQAAPFSSAPVPVSDPVAPAQQPSTDLFSLERPTSPGDPFARPADFDPFADSFDPLDSKPTQVNNNQIQDLQSGFSSGMILDSNDLLS